MADGAVLTGDIATDPQAFALMLSLLQHLGTYLTTHGGLPTDLVLQAIAELGYQVQTLHLDSDACA